MFRSGAGRPGAALSRALKAPVIQAPDTPHAISQTTPARALWGDRLLVRAFLVCGLLIAFQAGMALLDPPWIKPMTDWLRAALAWPELALVIWVSVCLTRAHRAGAASWQILSLAMLSYAIARNWWTVADLYVFPQGVPFPSLPDLFFLFQYPFFLLAVVLLPCIHAGAPRVRAILDDVLWIGTAAALSWYFILKHLYALGGESVLDTAFNLAYPIGDLVLFSGLAVATTRPSRSQGDRLALYVLCCAFLCLFTADIWAGVLTRAPRHVYTTGGAPDIFWNAFYLLVPLAGLVQLRLTQYEHPTHTQVLSERLQWRDVIVSIRELLPLMVTLLASASIILHAELIDADSESAMVRIVPFTVGLGLLALATARQVVVSLENEQLRRQQETVRANAAALREANRRMEEFMSVASHELKTPLTSLDGNVQLLAYRLDSLPRPDGESEGFTHRVGMMRLLIERCEESLGRLGCLVNHLLDDGAIHEGRLELRVELCDLSAVVHEAVEEHRLLTPDRVIELLPPTAPSIPVVADASRIQQVVANLLSNALKFSRVDQRVEVQVWIKGEVAGVSVRDWGAGVPPAEQTLIWQRFYRAAGVAIQSGSGVGMGLGLHICKSIVERHHGQVGVDSIPSQGSTFWFTLPLAR
jgi:signal transduction histidine kinase